MADDLTKNYTEDFSLEKFREIFSKYPHRDSEFYLKFCMSQSKGSGNPDILIGKIKDFMVIMNELMTRYYPDNNKKAEILKSTKPEIVKFKNIKQEWIDIRFYVLNGVAWFLTSDIKKCFGENSQDEFLGSILDLKKSNTLNNYSVEIYSCYEDEMYHFVNEYGLSIALHNLCCTSSALKNQAGFLIGFLSPELVNVVKKSFTKE